MSTSFNARMCVSVEVVNGAKDQKNKLLYFMTFNQPSRIIFIITLFCICTLSLPVFKIQRCEKPPPPDSSWEGISAVTNFILSDGTVPAKQQTTVYMCYNNRWVFIKFNCSDNNIFSPFTECNQPLYQYDVVEVFLTTPTSNNNGPNLHLYLELEVE